MSIFPESLERHMHNGVRLLICKHLFENGRLPKPSWTVGKTFHREDGTRGKVDFIVRCCDCQKLDPKRVDHHEYIWHGGLLHLADRSGQCEKLKRGAA